MNDAVYKFKRYEDSSLSYTGIDKHDGEAVGGYDTVITHHEYDRLFGAQQDSISEVAQTFHWSYAGFRVKVAQIGLI